MCANERPKKDKKTLGNECTRSQLSKKKVSDDRASDANQSSVSDLDCDDMTHSSTYLFTYGLPKRKSNRICYREMAFVERMGRVWG